MVLNCVFGILVGVVILSVLGVAAFSRWKENRGHRGAHSFEGSPIKQSEREVWGDPSAINAPPPRRRGSTGG
jgi:hypothetical protein